MLFNELLPEQKRKKFRESLKSGKLHRFPGSFSPLTSMMIEKIGFDGVYISGGVLANDLALPDIGLTTLTEVSQRARLIARSSRLPAIVDIDTGFGAPINVTRTIQEIEETGLCGCHMEDQISQKRCGHLDNKQLISQEEMVQKIQAASRAKRDKNFLLIARTDSRALEGLDKSTDRAKAYVDAGAEMIFPEALKNVEEFERFRKEIDVPLLANMTEFGKSSLLTADQLTDLGYNMVIYPVTSWRLAMKAVEKGLRTIYDEGTQESILDDMQHRKELYDLLDYENYNEFDQDIFNFKL